MATPGRQTRARSRQNTPAPAPLPAVDTRQSHAYGAKGKAHLKHQVVEQHTNFAEAFASGRDVPGSVAEESDEEEEELSSEQPGTRNGTVVDSVAKYEPSFTAAPRVSAATMPPPPPARRVAPRVSMRPATQMPLERDEAEPWSISVFLRAIPKYFKRNVGALLLGGLILAILLVIPMSGYPLRRRDEIVRGWKIVAGLPGYEYPPDEIQAQWNFLRYNATVIKSLPTMNIPEHQWMLNIKFLARIEFVEERMGWLEGNVTALQEYIPSRMVVDIVDGRMALKEEFWQVLLEKLGGSEQLYDHFMARNEQQAKEMATSAAVGYIEETIRSERILDRQAVLDLVSENNRQLEAQFRALLREAKDDVLRDAKSMAGTIALETVKKTPSDAQVQLALMAKSNLLHNTLEALNMVNHLSYTLGARVDPYNTSPTQAKSQNFVASLWMGGTMTAGKPPAHALTKWEEMGDCWCAAESEDRGKAQLAVVLGHAVSPEYLIVDHIPARGTLGIASAPRDFELWAETSSAEEAHIFREKITELFDDYNVQSCMTATAPPSKSAVCVGQGRYDIHGDDWVQTFQTFVDMRDVGLTTNKVIFRATSNWGAPHTCIYRLRLTGHDEEESEAAYGIE